MSKEICNVIPISPTSFHCIGCLAWHAEVQYNFLFCSNSFTTSPSPPFIDLPPNPEFLTWNKTQVDFRKETTLAVEEKILDRTAATCGE